jgi:hypothetical protein
MATVSLGQSHESHRIKAGLPCYQQVVNILQTLRQEKTEQWSRIRPECAAGKIQSAFITGQLVRRRTKRFVWQSERGLVSDHFFFNPRVKRGSALLRPIRLNVAWTWD